MSHWNRYAERSSVYGPPLRPAESAVARTAELVEHGSGRVLLLGVTPELAACFEPLLAVDKSEEMIATVWPGDSATRKAMAGDWLDIDLPEAGFRAVVGDGSLNNIASAQDVARLLDRALRWLVPGGRFACRVFERPEEGFSREQILDAGRTPRGLNFHALKWMIAMGIAKEQGAVVPVQRIRQRFEELFPDRELLAQATQWPAAVIDTIDVYRGSALAYFFPSRSEITALLPRGASNVAFHATTGYPLAECCPIVSFTR